MSINEMTGIIKLWVENFQKFDSRGSTSVGVTMSLHCKRFCTGPFTDPFHLHGRWFELLVVCKCNRCIQLSMIRCITKPNS